MNTHSLHEVFVLFVHLLSANTATGSTFLLFNLTYSKGLVAIVEGLAGQYGKTIIVGTNTALVDSMGLIKLFFLLMNDTVFASARWRI